MSLTRRELCLGIGLAALPEIAAAQQHAHEAANSSAPRRYRFIDATTAAEIDALTSQIIPSDDGPGAHEAGVVYFIDCALSSFEADKHEAYQSGMREVQSTREKLFPGSTSIASLTPAQQIELLRAIEKSEFFELLRTHTLWGFIGSPSYGGNREKVGWAHIRFEDQMHFEPPFGYYDAELLRGGK